jgi:hypothetical protein
MLRAENSMAARALRELGVDPDVVAAKIDELDPGTTTDADPEEAAARRMEIRLVDDEVHLILRDPTTVTVAKKVTELSGGPVQGVGPVAGMFVPLRRSTNQLLRSPRPPRRSATPGRPSPPDVTLLGDDLLSCGGRRVTSACRAATVRTRRISS